MAQSTNFDRRSFLKNAGGAALASAAASASALRATAAEAATASAPYDFDTVYNRFGTNCVKFDQQNRIYGRDSVKVGMGIADMDFKAAPVVTKALEERLRHENWGYPDMTRVQDEMSAAIAAWD